MAISEEYANFVKDFLEESIFFSIFLLVEKFFHQTHPFDRSAKRIFLISQKCQIFKFPPSHIKNAVRNDCDFFDDDDYEQI